MIAADTSTLIAYFRGESGNDVEILTELLRNNATVLCPAVLTELLSDPKLPAELSRFLTELPFLEVHEDYWSRVGLLRAKLAAKGRKARLADCLIIQTCIDHDVPLLTRDADFRKTAALTKIRLASA